MTDDEKVDAAVRYLTETDYVHHPGVWLDDVFVYCHLDPNPNRSELYAYRRRDLIDWHDRALAWTHALVRAEPEQNEYDDDEPGWHEVGDPPDLTITERTP